MPRSILWSVIFFARFFNLDAEGDQDIKTTMNSGCDAQSLHGDGAPIRVTFEKIYKWPEADVEFLRDLSKNEQRAGMDQSVSNSERRVYHMGLASRQRYLRSYTFRRMTASEKIKRWFKEKLRR